MPYPRLKIDSRLTRRTLPDSPNLTDIYAGAIGPDGRIWLLDYNQLCVSSNGIDFTLVATAGAPDNKGFYACEALFVSSAGDVYTVHTNTGASQGLLRRYTAAAGSPAWSTIKCAGTETDWHFPVTGGIDKTAYFEPWSIWEIEDPREAVGGLEIGDIIIGCYHRGDYTTTPSNPRTAYLWVVRNGEINADESTYLPTDAATAALTADAVAEDWFTTWNGSKGTIARHIHHVTMGLDGHLYLTCGDFKTLYTGSLQSITNTESEDIVLTTMRGHGMRIGDKVTVAGCNVSALNAEHTVKTVVSAGDGSSNGSVTLETVGTGASASTPGTWTLTTPWAAGDSGHFYRMIKLTVGGTAVEEMDGPLAGYTAMFRRDDGKFVVGNDTGTATPDGDDMPIKIFDPVTRTLTTVYTAGTAQLDGAIWDIVGVHGDQHLLASVQQTGSMGYTVHGALLESWDGGWTWERIALSGKKPEGIGFRNFDRIFRDRRRRVPAGVDRVPVSVQPAQTTGNKVYFTLWAGEGTDAS